MQLKLLREIRVGVNGYRFRSEDGKRMQKAKEEFNGLRSDSLLHLAAKQSPGISKFGAIGKPKILPSKVASRQRRHYCCHDPASTFPKQSTFELFLCCHAVLTAIRNCFTYLSTDLPIYLSTYLLIYLSTYLLIYLSTYLLIYLSTYLLIYLSTIYPSTCLSMYLPVNLSAYLPINFTSPLHLLFACTCPRIWFNQWKEQNLHWFLGHGALEAQLTYDMLQLGSTSPKSLQNRQMQFESMHREKPQCPESRPRNRKKKSLGGWEDFCPDWLSWLLNSCSCWYRPVRSCHAMICICL